MGDPAVEVAPSAIPSTLEAPLHEVGKPATDRRSIRALTRAVAPVSERSPLATPADRITHLYVTGAAAAGGGDQVTVISISPGETPEEPDASLSV